MHNKLQDYKKALEKYEESLKIKTSTKGIFSIEVAETLTKVA